MAYAAHQTGHTKVLVGDSATRLGIGILSSITQGRGAHLAMQVVSNVIPSNELSALAALNVIHKP